MDNSKEIVFTNKNARIKAFTSAIVFMTVVDVVIVLVTFFIKRLSIESLPFIGGITLALSLVWGVLIGLGLVKNMGSVHVIVNDECVEYISGRSHRYYALVDFIESQTYVLYRGKKPQNVRRLVFDGYNNILYIHERDFSEMDFKQLSEVVEDRAQKVKGIAVE